MSAGHAVSRPPECPSRIAAACDCRAWCRDDPALDRLDPLPAVPWQWPAYPEAGHDA